MAQLPVPEFAGSLFARDEASKTYSAEASDLRFCRAGMLYDDAADVGIQIVTNSAFPALRIARFALVETRSSEGGVLWWRFEPCLETLRKTTALDGWSIKIFND